MNTLPYIQLEGFIIDPKTGAQHFNPLVVLMADQVAQAKALHEEIQHWRSNHDAIAARAQLLRQRLDMPVERVKAYDLVLQLTAEKADLLTALNETIQARTAQDLEIKALQAELDLARVSSKQRSDEAAQAEAQDAIAQALLTTAQALHAAKDENALLHKQVEILQGHPDSYQTGYLDGRRIGTKYAQEERTSLSRALRENKNHTDMMEQFFRNADEMCRALELRMIDARKLLNHALEATPFERQELIQQALDALNKGPMRKKDNLYTSVSAGGDYELIGAADGAGESRGDSVTVYRNVSTGKLWYRLPADFKRRMICRDSSAPAFTDGCRREAQGAAA